MNNIEKIFSKKRSILIGAIHLPPLLGYPDFPGFEVALKNALSDIQAYGDGQFDAVIVENNYDIPHRSQVGPEIVASMTYLIGELKKHTRLPIGVSVLWNDYRAALAIAKTLSCQFIRVPVFVDSVVTNYGPMSGNPKDVLAFRKEIGADDVAIFSDIHVKHSRVTSPHPITESAQLAIDNQADAIIVTGQWTGDAPDADELKQVRSAVGDFPIICGSGVNQENIKKLFVLADGAIVSTSLKTGPVDGTETNLKKYGQRISIDKVHELVKQIK